MLSKSINDDEKSIVRIIRIYAGEDGKSHFEDIDLQLTNAGEIGKLSEIQPATGIMFRDNHSDYFQDWHNAPRRQYNILLEGEIEIEIGDGTKRRFCSGDIFLAEDTSGQGHRTRSISQRHYRSVFVTVD